MVCHQGLAGGKVLPRQEHLGRMLGLGDWVGLCKRKERGPEREPQSKSQSHRVRERDRALKQGENGGAGNPKPQTEVKDGTNR